MEDVAWQEREETTFKRGELPGRFMAKTLYGWSDKRYDQEYWEKLERNWRRWKGKKPARRGMMKTIPEEKEEVEEEKSGVREWTEEDEDEMGNMVDPYYELQRNSSGRGNLREGWCHDLANWLSHYLYFFSFFSFLFLFTTTRWSTGKYHVTLSQCHNGVMDGHSVSHD